MKLKTKCSFCGAKAQDKDTHLIIALEKAAICTRCVTDALFAILTKIPNGVKVE
jgi:hypothetical protein